MKNNIILLFLALFVETGFLMWETTDRVSAQEIEIEIEEVEEEEEEEEDIPTRSYIGLGGTIGLSGSETALGEGGFSLLGRTAITRNISLHTSSVFADDGISNFALTFGVPIFKSSESNLELVYPFVGGGIAVEDFFDSFNVNGLVTTGVDIPILPRVTSTVRLNIGFGEDDTDVGLLLGVGYNFSIFELF